MDGTGKRGGRSPGTRNKRTLELLTLAEAGETPCAYALRIMRDEKQTADIRMHAAKMAAPYIHPKPQPERRLVSFDFSDKVESTEGLLLAHEALLRATAIGGVALEDAKDISSILETHRRLVETVDLEQRLTRLEQDQKK